MSRALISVSNKTGIVDFARGLAARGYELVSTGGTARTLSEAGLPVTNVSDITGFPEMMDGRVKTLHPNVHGGILARRTHPEDLAAIAAHGIHPIDIVVVNLYPFAETAKKPNVTFDELIENIDIGGPSMVRAAAKNFQDVLVVVDPADYGRVLDALHTTASPELRYELMVKAFAHTAEYDTTIAAKLGKRDLRYGENPHQKATWYAVDGARGFGRANILQGKELSYTNLLDLDAAARIVLEFNEPAAAVIKHTNPCGAAIAASIAEAYIRARDADAIAAFGGIVGLNRPVDVASADAIVSTFIEAVVAPSVDEAAKPILAKKPNMRVVTADFSAFKEATVEYRSILGAMLMQERDRVLEANDDWKVVTKRAPTADEWTALRFAWRICAHVKSNTIIFTNDHRTLAIGAGQMSRVDAANVAVMKAKAANISLAGSAVASDAFFPFRDGLDVVAAAGARAIVQPGGSVRDADVIAAADEHGLAMVFTGRRHFRH
ncbi:MAG TPA: bifunctional phosphoribosylaminoimidazolecarboxamide formyltransferase/IMP cyclohydrolase [Vicinamibacterales bacterium]|nr:bifunctional phosphoribosylaminoimidazolecarboxamide formyltransferase/IMP cyclohydrolase [Vicinamibacterales bacterium]